MLESPLCVRDPIAETDLPEMSADFGPVPETATVEHTSLPITQLPPDNLPSSPFPQQYSTVHCIYTLQKRSTLFFLFFIGVGRLRRFPLTTSSIQFFKLNICVNSLFWLITRTSYVVHQVITTEMTWTDVISLSYTRGHGWMDITWSWTRD